MSVGPNMSVEELNQLANMNQQVTNPNYGAGSGYQGMTSGNNLFRDVLDVGSEYYNQQQEIGRATDLRNLALQTGQQAGQTAAEMAKFQPYTVTSNLAKGITDEQGGLDLQLSPEEQARQNQYLGQAQGLFGGVGQDVAEGSQALYEQLRAAQRPEEERERMRMQEGLFASGRQGISSAAYGGTPEQLAFEKARQESMLNAQIAARTQFGSEQDRLLTQAQGLQTAGYNPQRQAIDLFGASATPADIAGAGRRQGASVYGQSALQGLEGMLQAQQLANDLRATRDQGIQTSLFGSSDIGGQVTQSLLESGVGRIGDYLGGASWNPFGYNYGGDLRRNTTYDGRDTGGGVLDVGSILDLPEDFDITKE